MANYLSEDHLEQADIDLFINKLGYDEHINAYRDKLLGRSSLKEVVLKDRLRAKLEAFNTHLPPKAIDDALEKLTQSRASMSAILANKEVHNLIKDGVPITYTNHEGKETPTKVQVVDFDNAAANEFLVVSQLSIQYRDIERNRRPDVLLYVNGLPLVFIELKNASEKVRQGYDKNLEDYKRDIPQLFDYNLLVCISNGIQTRMGSFNADWEHFFPWVKHDDTTANRRQLSLQEVEKRSETTDKRLSLEYFSEGLCNKTTLLDYFENFVLYHNNTKKILAKNHQYLGVNSALKAFTQREDKKGKLGVFWHTQGSGKSYSMIFYAEKINRKIPGDFSFLILTDRTDLDDQIFRNFTETEAITGISNTKNNKYRPKNKKELLQFLGENKSYVFSLIQKFGTKRGLQFKQITDRTNWIVMIDEAHRSQYKSLADNLRIGLPNAQYLAFTGTPLIKGGLTERWFGDYVSEYNFAQAIEDEATVPLFYKKHVPTMVNVKDDKLIEEAADILEKEDITEEEEQKLNREYSTIIEVVKRDDRLEVVAQDILEHYPYRLDMTDDEGNRKPMKAMVVCIDKYTAAKMYEKIQYKQELYIRELNKKISRTFNIEERTRYERAVAFMKETQMSVVISSDINDEKRFAKKGLDVSKYHKMVDARDNDGKSVEDYFKDANHPLRIVFVTAMWLTGFDAPSVSTLYLDKPLRNHNLMQTIARANRVFAAKKNGLVVDYFGVFRNLKKALAVYAQGSSDKVTDDDDMPIQEFEELVVILKDAIDEGMQYSKDNGADLQEILDIGEKGFKEIRLFETFGNLLLVNDDVKKQFALYTNAIVSLYDSCKPDIYNYPIIKQQKEVFEYLKKVVERNAGSDERMDKVREQVDQLLDESILKSDDAVQEESVGYEITKHKQIDLSKLDIDKLRKEFKERDTKNIAFADLREFLGAKLQQMIRENKTRTRFLERFQEILDEYNSGSTSIEEMYEEMLKYAKEVQKEEERHIREELTPEELEVYDMLCKEKLTKAELQRVKLASKYLLNRLKEEKEKLFVIDWYKSYKTRLRVQNIIKDLLDDKEKGLPKSYDVNVFAEKSNEIFDHIFNSAMNGTGIGAA
ncbi:type I restriction endonuclease subunit R [Kordia sp. YSTF-M3]|uniref:Type I restriction enzyme endonuclease subunit n=1 Tax=Kordia aestuariivivens TaxID=2759037 RepID=A0ABR7QDG6_9FLAO|nr:type I restriction endonuclease subunit R [Kordia aestuariivivens]MBC8756426.1 type I restriction endonuclease subunit R [Kordia aestuariivivens]